VAETGNSPISITHLQQVNRNWKRVTPVGANGMMMIEGIDGGKVGTNGAVSETGVVVVLGGARDGADQDTALCLVIRQLKTNGATKKCNRTVSISKNGKQSHCGTLETG
jgi:hypothetical protein